MAFRMNMKQCSSEGDNAMRTAGTLVRDNLTDDYAMFRGSMVTRSGVILRCAADTEIGENTFLVI